VAVEATRAELKELVWGVELAEAAIEGYSDQKVVRTMELLLGIADDEQIVPDRRVLSTGGSGAHRRNVREGLAI
jgi:hypothetical protein